MSKVYQLSDYTRIKEKGFNYTIPDESRELITLLANLVGSPNYSKSPYFLKTDKKKKKTSTVNSDANWDILRQFKKTEVKEKNDTEKELDAIRILLNKLTEDNYDKLSMQIQDKLNSLDDENIFKEVISLLFTIASTNRFFSNLYAKLYTKLKNEFSCLKQYFDNTLNGYMELFKNIESCNPEKDYNKFCEINKQNEHRRSITAFIVNCMNINELDVNIITELVFYLQRLITNSHNDTMKIEEITENFFIIVSIGLDKIVLSDEWGEIYEYIQQNSTNKNFNNKIRFRFMDLLDLTN